MCTKLVDSSFKCTGCKLNIHFSCSIYYNSHDESMNINICPICYNTKSSTINRENSLNSLRTQAKRMLNYSDKILPPAKKGDTVAIPVPEVDKGRGDARNIMACVTDVDPNGLYRLGTPNGTINQMYARSKFTLCKEKIISQDKVTDNQISLRSLATFQSTGTGQGFVKCKCKDKCNNRRCICRKKEILCGSKCRCSSECCNKD